MNLRNILFFFFFQFVGIFLFAQEGIALVESDFFEIQEPLEVTMEYSIRELRKNSKDSIWTFIQLGYIDEEGSKNEVEVRLETRGNFRLNNCYFPPVKVRIKKKQRKGTIFENHKEMKLVMPCRKESHGNDYIIKEYLAYKLYESIAPVHFRTRLLKINFTELRKKKSVEYDFYGFFIEDIKKVAKRNNGKEIKKYIHQMSHEAEASVRNSLFQYMIGNVDYSAGHRHNGKLVFVEDKGTTSVLYDFDMSGFVDPSYGQLPMVGGEVIDLESIKQRLYRGYLRDEIIMQSVRNDFISNKDSMFGIIEAHSQYFAHEKEKKEAVKYLESFFKIIEDDKLFHREIISKARIL